MKKLIKFLGFKNRKESIVIENQEPMEMDDLAKLLQKMLEDLKSKERDEELFKTVTWDGFYPKPNIRVDFDGFSATIKINTIIISYSDLSKASKKYMFDIIHELSLINNAKTQFEINKQIKEIKQLYENY